ncbi:hypothetical protein Scep_006979 [Stephania cephalantha]|uniref:Uncharacterized protein n=1 Tax=Stephania cephalantha TaxID=152367 RepID=A0AAP0PLC0_9MAGN
MLSSSSPPLTIKLNLTKNSLKFAAVSAYTVRVVKMKSTFRTNGNTSNSQSGVGTMDSSGERIIKAK